MIHKMETYNDGIQDAIDLLQDCGGNSIEWLVDRLQDFQYAYRLEQDRLSHVKEEK